MRKFLSLILIFSLNAYAVPPVSVDSEQSAVGNYVQNTKLPNEQATQLTTRNTRIETGNTNLLKNPSFEHLTLGFGWTITNATYALNTTNQVEGKKAITLTPTAAMTFGQDSTINAANINGLQGVASVKIKATGTTGLKVCPRNAGAAITSLCVNVAADSTWKHISIPFILGATSNGIGIATTATGGTVIVDDAFVGTSAPFQDVSGARLMGTVKVSGCSANWTTSATSFTDFSAQAGCSYAVTGSASAPSTNIPAIKFSSLPAGDYRLEAEGQLLSSGTSNNAQFQFWDGTNSAKEVSSSNGPSSSSVAIPGINQSLSYSTAQTNITFSVRGQVNGSATATIYGSTAFPLVIKVWYFPPASKIYSQASQDVSFQACTFSSLTWNGLGTITNNLLCARKGQSLIIKGKWRTGTVSATTAAIPLPTNFGSIAVSSSIGALQVFGMGFRDTSSAGAGYVYHAAGSSTSLSISPSLFNSATNPLTQANGSTTFASAEMQHIPEISIPIEGWQDYGVIVGSFAGLEKCANDYECTDTFSAHISSAGVVTNENVDWINGNCSISDTSLYACTYNTNLKDGISALSSNMNCIAKIYSTFTDRDVSSFITANATTSVTVRTIFDDAAQSFVRFASDFDLVCTKGSQDYKPKTAKVASSIGVPTVPGITTQAIDTFSFSYGTTNATTVCSASPCSYLDQIGTAVTSVTRASAGDYTINLSKTYSKVNCTASVKDASGGYGAITYKVPTCSGTCSSINFTTVAAGIGTLSVTYGNTYGTVVCQGQY